MPAVALRRRRPAPLRSPTRGRAAGSAMQPRLGSRHCVSRALVHALVSSSHYAAFRYCSAFTGSR